jgi:outer membrane protein OmpA-like peptidoglycan-associated protein
VLLSRKAPNGRSDGGDGQHRHFLSIKMMPKQISPTLAIMVTEPAIGWIPAPGEEEERAPVHGVQLQVCASAGGVSNSLVWQGTTSSAGLFRAKINLLEPTKLVVHAMKEGYKRISTIISIEEKHVAETISVPIEMHRSGVVAPLCVVAKSLETGAELHGALVQVSRKSDRFPVASGLTDGQGRFQSELVAHEPAEYVVSVAKDGFLDGSHELLVALSQRYDITIALAAPPVVLLRVRVGSDEDGGKPISGAIVKVVDETNAQTTITQAVSSVKGETELMVQRKSLEGCTIMVQKKGWAGAQVMVPTIQYEPTANTHLTEFLTQSCQGPGGHGTQAPAGPSKVVDVGITMAHSTNAKFDVELLIAVGNDSNTVGMINIDAQNTTLRDVRRQLRSEQLQGVIPLAYHFVLKTVPCGVQTELVKLANDAHPVLVLMPLPTIKPYVRSITPSEATVVWEHPAEAAAAGQNAYVVEVWCGSEAEEHRRLASDGMLNGMSWQFNGQGQECAFVLDMFHGKPLVMGQQYDICIRSASNERLREAVVPLTIRIPLDEGQPGADGAGASGGGGGRSKADQRLASSIHRSVLFYANSSQWLEESVSVLDEVARILRENSNLRIQVRGYSNGGMGSLNMEDELSWSRAANVCEYMVAQGARPAQLELEGRGAQGMVVPPTGQSAYKNRRVEFRALW